MEPFVLAQQPLGQVSPDTCVFFLTRYENDELYGEPGDPAFNPMSFKILKAPVSNAEDFSYKFLENFEVIEITEPYSIPLHRAATRIATKSKRSFGNRISFNPKDAKIIKTLETSQLPFKSYSLSDDIPVGHAFIWYSGEIIFDCGWVVIGHGEKRQIIKNENYQDYGILVKLKKEER